MASKFARKRTPRQREADLELLAGWAVEGLTIWEMTGRLNALRNRPEDGSGYTLTPQAVGQDLKALEKRWRAHADLDFAAARDRTLAELRHIRRVAWAEWHRSREDAVTTLAEQTNLPPPPTPPGQAPQAGGTRQRAGKRVQGRLGDPRYLETIFKALDREAKLLGLDALDNDLRDLIRREAEDFAREAGLSVEEVLAEAEAIVRRIQEDDR